MTKRAIARSLVLVATLAAGVRASVSQESSAPAPAPLPKTALVNAIGYEIDLDHLPSPHPRPEKGPAEPRTPRVVRVGIPWELVEKSRGSYDWSVTDEIIVAHAEAGYLVAASPHGGNPLYGPTEPAAAEEGWLSFLRALASRYAGPVDTYVLALDEASLEPGRRAYRMKLSSVTIQSVDAGARIVMSVRDPSAPEPAALLTAAYQEGVAPYVDAVAFEGDGETEALKKLMLLHDPTAKIWWVERPVAGGAGAGGGLLRGFLEGVEKEAAVSLFVLEFDGEGRPGLLPVIDRIRATFSPGCEPLVESGRGVQIMTTMGQPVAARTWRLFDPEAKLMLLAYDAGTGAVRGTQAVVAVDTLDVAEPVLKDVAAGEEARVSGYQKDEAAGLTRMALPIAEYPLVLQFRRFTSPLFAQEEKLEVSEKRLPSVEEILANHQTFQAAQDATLANLRADARVDYHFRIGASSSIDVTQLNAFYYDPKVGAEWELKEFYVNGIKWRSDRAPELPLPQPEKVLTLPLDITLDRRYVYRLAGEETAGGYDCWTIDFEPAAGEENLYKGRVWIDKKTFAKVQISSLQTGLKAPILSNDEKDSYRPLTGPQGLQYWVLNRIDGQQIFSTSGRNFVLVREVTLSNHVINDPSFEELKSQAHASTHQILRETEAGPRYLDRTEQGTRVVRDKLDRDNLFLAGGVFYNRSLDFPIPLAGINYFNRDLGGRGIQTNIFFAGPLLFANASHPALFGSKVEGSVDLFAQGFSSTDRPVGGDEEIEREAVDLIGQHLGIGIGFPFADHWKIKLSAGLDFNGFSKDQDTSESFVIPQDTYVTTTGLEGEFNRKGWAVSASITASSRRRWEPWGDPNALSGQTFFIGSKDFLAYEGTVAKDFFLPLNQKIHVSATAFGGSDLDRFGKYRFDFFGNRLRGFAGAGIRYTNGARGRLQYAFNLGEVIRFEATVDHARVTDSEVPQDGPRRFSGIGLSGQTIVGPNLIVSLDWGLALASDVEEFKGDQEILFTLLKFFQ